MCLRLRIEELLLTLLGKAESPCCVSSGQVNGPPKLCQKTRRRTNGDGCCCRKRNGSSVGVASRLVKRGVGHGEQRLVNVVDDDHSVSARVLGVERLLEEEAACKQKREWKKR